MGKKRHTELDGEQNETADAGAFRAAVRDVKPLIQVPPAKGLAKPAPRARLRRPAAAATETLDDMMPLIAATAADGGAAQSFHRARSVAAPAYGRHGLHVRAGD
jgi:hypothetical protein